MHWARRAASRAAWIAGSSKAMRMAMMAMTTNNSMSVKPRRVRMRFPLSGSQDLKIDFFTRFDPMILSAG